jgi:hypothetical protein
VNDTRNARSKSDTSTSNTDSDLFAFLRNKKNDIYRQNERLVAEVGDVNSKIDSLFSSINELKQDNERLKHDKDFLRVEIFPVINKLNVIENQSRRNNLRFNEIHGNINEALTTSEEKVRSVLKETLNLYELADTVEIDRAQRIKSHNPTKCTILVRFNKYKDCVQILQCSNY